MPFVPTYTSNWMCDLTLLDKDYRSHKRKSNMENKQLLRIIGSKMINTPFLQWMCFERRIESWLPFDVWPFDIFHWFVPLKSRTLLCTQYAGLSLICTKQRRTFDVKLASCWTQFTAACAHERQRRQCCLLFDGNVGAKEITPNLIELLWRNN